MAGLSPGTRRAIFGGVGVPALLLFLNYYANLNWLGGYDFYAMLAALASILIAVPLIAGEQGRSK